MRVFIVVGALMLFAIGARGDDGAAPAECPPRAVLDAAKSALAAGDRERALHYMRRAKELLRACEERLPAIDPRYEPPQEQALARTY
jgi:hypothetical protein